jgi:hypothetical protein
MTDVSIPVIKIGTDNSPPAVGDFFTFSSKLEVQQLRQKINDQFSEAIGGTVILRIANREDIPLPSDTAVGIPDLDKTKFIDFLVAHGVKGKDKGSVGVSVLQGVSLLILINPKFAEDDSDIAQGGRIKAHRHAFFKHKPMAHHRYPVKPYPWHRSRSRSRSPYDPFALRRKSRRHRSRSPYDPFALYRKSRDRSRSRRFGKF